MSMYPKMDQIMKKEKEKYSHLEDGWNRPDNSLAKTLYKASMGTPAEKAEIERQKGEEYARRVEAYNRGEIPVAAIMYPEIHYPMSEKKEDGESRDLSGEWVAEHGTIDGFEEYMEGLKSGLNLK